MNKFKVLNVNMSIDPVEGGGTAERTYQMSLQLARAGVDCTILTLDLGLTAARRKGLGTVALIALPCLNRRFYLPGVSWGRIKNIVAKADVVHLMGHWTILNGLVYMAARSLKKPYVVCPAGALPIFGRSKILKGLYNRAGGKRLVANANRCIAITTDEKGQLHEYGVVDDKIAVIPNGINAEDYSSRDDAGFRARFGLGDAPFILFVGRLNRIKGPDLLLQAFSEAQEALGGFHLVFAGPDEGLLVELKTTAAERGLEGRIHFVGYLGGAEKSQAYHAAELLAIPSRQEAMSIVVLEAGIVGTPVLLTNQCGLDEIGDIGGGRVVPPTVAELRQGLVELCADRSRLESMGKILQGYVAKRFLWDSVVNAYIELYVRLLGRSESEAVFPQRLGAGTISAVIPCYNRGHLLEKCIQGCLGNENLRLIDEIIIVDDGSNDGTVPPILEKYRSNPRVRPIASAKNQGLSKARNVGIRAAKNQIIFSLDSDIVLDRMAEGVLADCVKMIQRQSNRVIIGNLRYPKSVVQQSNHVYWLNSRYPVFRRGIDCSNLHHRLFSGGFFMAAKTSLAEAGLFDENIKFYGMEDLVLGYKLHQSGAVFQMVRGLSAQHFDEPSLGRTRSKAMELGQHNLDYVGRQYPDLVSQTGFRFILPSNMFIRLLQKVFFWRVFVSIVSAGAELSDRFPALSTSWPHSYLFAAWSFQGMSSKKTPRRHLTYGNSRLES
jgi:glycosyltransferase involved in cell wall biosynthesis